MGANNSKGVGQNASEAAQQQPPLPPPIRPRDSHIGRKQSIKRLRELSSGSGRLHKKLKRSENDERWREDFYEDDRLEDHVAEHIVGQNPTVLVGSSHSNLDVKDYEPEETSDAIPGAECGAFATSHDERLVLENWRKDVAPAQGSDEELRSDSNRATHKDTRLLSQRAGGEIEDSHPLVKKAVERLQGLETDRVYSKETLHRSKTQFSTIQQLLGQKPNQEANPLGEDVDFVAVARNGELLFDGLVHRRIARQRHDETGKDMTDGGAKRNAPRRALKLKRRVGDVDSRSRQRSGQQRRLKGCWKGWPGMLSVKALD